MRKTEEPSVGCSLPNARESLWRLSVEKDPEVTERWEGTQHLSIPTGLQMTIGTSHRDHQ